MTKNHFPNAPRHVLMACLTVACGCGDEGAATHAEILAGNDHNPTREQALYVLATNAWPNAAAPGIPVCWERLEDSTPEQKEIVRSAVANTWEYYANIRFIGWGDCRHGSSGISIRVGDAEWPSTMGLGTDLAGASAGMRLNFTYGSVTDGNGTPKFVWCRTHADYCTEVIAVHEFGHALGFSHEQNRTDVTPTCGACASNADCATSETCDEGFCRQGTNGDTTIGGFFDQDSVMSYCADDWNNEGDLTEVDVFGVQYIYGANPQYLAALVLPLL